MALRKLLLTASTATLLAFGGLAVSSVAANAYVACNHEGDCWHTDSRVRAPGIRFDYHPDHWYFHQRWDGGDRHYRDYHEGRGYYKGGVWINL